MQIHKMRLKHLWPRGLYNKNLRRIAVTVIVTATFICGCSTDNISKQRSELSDHPKENIKKSGDVFDLPCQRFASSNDGSRAFFGIEVGSTSPIVIGYFYCNSVSPAKNEGILVGDKIVSIRNCPVVNAFDVKSLIEDTVPRTLAFVKVDRNGKLLDFPVKPLVHKPMGKFFPSRSFFAKTCNTN